jgi:hypothetical protein
VPTPEDLAAALRDKTSTPELVPSMLAQNTKSLDAWGNPVAPAPIPETQNPSINKFSVMRKDGKEIPVVHEVVSPEKLQEICNIDGKGHPDDRGCYRTTWGSTHYIYTLTPDEWKKRGDPEQYQRTLDHEIKHILEGDFHGEDRGAPSIPRTGRGAGF